MRVIAGQAKGRLLKVPKGPVVRPTSDYLREALFNILGERVQGAWFLDLFAGSGAVGIEALSRGAEFVTFVEKNPQCVQALRANLKRSGFKTQAEIIPTDVLRFLADRRSQRGYDVIFLDPPYHGLLGEEALSRLGQGLVLRPKSLVIAEVFHKRALPPAFGLLRLVREVRHGQTKLVFYTNLEGS